MTRHPSREEIIEAADSDHHNLNEHLARCDDCRAIFELFCRFKVQGEPPLPDAPSTWVRRARTIGRRTSEKQSISKWVARLVFDSWSGDLALGVRGEASDERRLRFNTEELSFDLRAERRQGNWQFIGKVLRASDDSQTCRLRAGRRIINPDDAGYFIWSSKTPPGKLTLECETEKIEIEQIPWKRPNT